jgi:hypothetical protein
MSNLAPETAFLAKFNNLQQAVVLRTLIDGRVKITDRPDFTRDIVKLQNPDVIIDIHHTYHQLYNDHKVNKLKVTFGEVADLTGVISVLRPGSIVQEVTLVENLLQIRNTDGGTVTTLCSRVAVKVSGFDK